MHRRFVSGQDTSPPGASHPVAGTLDVTMDSYAAIGSCASGATSFWSHLANQELRRRPVFLFAHPDDAVISAFFALWDARSSALDLVVCAGRPSTPQPGPWDTACGFVSSGQAHETRAAEHQQACSLVETPTFSIGLQDNQYGGSSKGAWVAALDDITARLHAAQATLIVTHSPQAMHPDHRRVVRVARESARRIGVPVLYTCDRPYFVCTAGRCCSGRARRSSHSWAVTACLPPIVWNAKRQALACYASQRSALLAAFGRKWHWKETLGRECYLLSHPQAPRPSPTTPKAC